MDITYLGPVDSTMLKRWCVFNEAKRGGSCRFRYVLTKKKEKGIFLQRKIRQKFLGQVRSILGPRCERIKRADTYTEVFSKVL